MALSRCEGGAAGADAFVGLKGTLSKVALVIKEANIADTPLERFVFDIDWLVPAGEMPDPERDWTCAPRPPLLRFKSREEKC